MCGNRVCNVCAVPADESQEGYDEQNYRVGKCPNGACEQMKDKIKEKDMVTQSIKRKGKIFGSFLRSSLENYMSNNTTQHETTRHNTRQHEYNTT